MIEAYEHRSQPVLPLRLFYRRMVRSGSIALVLIAMSLAIGMTGYHVLEHLGWLDAFLNAAMLLGGMGPVNTPASWGGKLFAGLYALYCGLVVIAVAGLLLAPALHRLMHKFHLEKREREKS
jgi:hypothetical protein